MNLLRESKPPHQTRNPALSGFCLWQNLSSLWRGGKEKGFTLLITFFIMGISLSVVLGVSAILVGQIKMIRGMGDSVRAFYAADTGIEEVIYFDNKKIPLGGATRGFCDICNVCPSFGCQSCVISGLDCDFITCANCHVSYYVETEDKKYNVTGNITPTGESFESFGTYLKTTRAIGLNFAISENGTSSQAPSIAATAEASSSVPEQIDIAVSADISDPDGVDSAAVFAHIQNPDETDVSSVLLIYSSATGKYIGTWTGPDDLYYIDVTACDIYGNCGEAENITITYY